MTNKLKLTTLLICGTSTIAAAQSVVTPSAPNETNAARVTESPAVSALEGAFKLPKAEAIRRAALEEQVVDLAGTLRQAYPDSWGGMFVDHTPVYQVRIAFNTEVNPADVLRRIPPALRSVVKVTRVRENDKERREALREAASVLRAKSIPFQLRYDSTADGIDIGLPSDDLAPRAREALGGRWKDRVRFSRGGPARRAQYLAPTGIKAGDEVQAGWYHYRQQTNALDPTGQERGMCTYAFGGRNSYGQSIVTSAGHCVDDTYRRSYTQVGGRLLELPLDGRTSSTSRGNYRSFANDPYYDYAHLNAQGLPVSYWLWVIRRANPRVQHSYFFPGKANLFAEGVYNDAPYLSGEYLKVSGVRRYWEHVEGTTVCKQGSLTGFTCMIIRSSNYSDAVVDSFVETYNSRQPYPAAQGDSGGPFFTPPDPNGLVKAVGILSGVVDAANPEDDAPCRTGTIGISGRTTTCTQTYMPIDRIDDQFPIQLFIYPSGTVSAS